MQHKPRISVIHIIYSFVYTLASSVFSCCFCYFGNLVLLVFWHWFLENWVVLCWPKPNCRRPAEFIWVSVSCSSSLEEVCLLSLLHSREIEHWPLKQCWVYFIRAHPMVMKAEQRISADFRVGLLGWGNLRREHVVTGNTQRKIDKPW